MRYYIVKTTTTLFFSIVLSLLAFAQKGNVRGFIYDQASGEPVIFTNVILDGTNMGAATDVNGYFSITKIPAGTYTLAITSLGYEKYEETVEVNENIINKKIYLRTGAVNMKTVEVSAKKKEATTKVQMSVAKITPKEIKNLPSIGGEPDLAQYLQVLPGVVFTGDQGGQIYIRGGAPIQNKLLMDGMIIYNPFHSIGLYSVFDTDIIRNADIYTGGFNAQFGGRASSIMDITTKDGNYNRFGGKVNVSPFSAKAILEGPLKKATGKGGSSSFLLSYRNSYLDKTSKALYSYANEDGLPFKFQDLYGKLSFNAGNGSKFNVFGFNFTDNVSYEGVSDFGWTNYGVGSNFILVPSGSPVLVEGNFSYTDYDIKMQEPDKQARTSSIDGFNLGLNFKYFSGNNEFKYGLNILGFSTEFDFYNDAGLNINQTENTTELAGFLVYKISTGRLVLEPSMRLHYYASLSEMSPEPRLGLKYNISESLRFKAAGGFYSQNLIAANSDRDVVNLFYGFLSGPDNLPSEVPVSETKVKERTSALQKAIHYIAGFEYDVNDAFNINVEGYIKDFTQLTNINRFKLYEDDGSVDNFSREEYEYEDYLIETGLAKGIDFAFKYNKPKYNASLIYSLSKVDRYNGIERFFPVFDRRHNINVLANIYFGNDNSWELGMRWNLGTGFPFTQSEGFFEKLPFTTNGISTDPTTENGIVGYNYGDYNGARLPTFHRFDASIKKTTKFSKDRTLETTFSVSNLYNRENLFYVNRLTFDKVYQLPILPSLSVTYSF